MWDADRAVVRLTGGAALSEVLDAADPAAWTALDETVRNTSWQRHNALPTRTEVAAYLAARRDGARLALALCHPDGRVRASALEEAAAATELLPLIAVRCTDWAAPVRERARELLRTAMPAVGVAELSQLGAVLLRLGRRQRGDFGADLLHQALRALPDDGVRKLLDVPDRAMRRLVWRCALERGTFAAAELAGAAARGHDVVVRRLCADAVLALVGPQTGDDVLGPLLAARSADVRAAGVTALRRAGRAAQAEPYLADRSATVRACARYVLRQAGVDPLPRYRSWCADPCDASMPAGAPVGLAECGAREDAGLLWPLLGHPVAAVRAQAVAGLRLLEAVDAERLRPLLADPAPAVARETAKALAPDAGRLPVGWLTGLLAPDRPPHTRHAAFRLLDARGGLDQLRAAAALLDDPDTRLRFRAEQSARRWQRPVRLTDGGAAALAPLLARCAQLRRSRY